MAKVNVYTSNRNRVIGRVGDKHLEVEATKEGARVSVSVRAGAVQFLRLSISDWERLQRMVELAIRNPSVSRRCDEDESWQK